MNSVWVLFTLLMAACSGDTETETLHVLDSAEPPPADGSPVVMPLVGHSDGINAVAYHPDGTIVASGSIDGTIRLWSTSDGTEVATLASHDSWVTDVAFSPDGTRLASSSHDQTVRLWDVANGTEEVLSSNESGRALSVAFSPDGSSLATGWGDDSVRIWDVGNLRELAVLPHSGDVYHVAYSPDGALLAAGTLSATVVWELDGQRELAQVDTGPNGIAFRSDGQELAIADYDFVLLWDRNQGVVSDTLRPSPGRSTAVAISSGGRRLAIAGRDGTISIWDRAEMRELAVVRGMMGWFLRDIAFSPNDAQLAVGAWDAAVWLWNVDGSIRAYEQGEMPYGQTNEVLPAGVARDCDTHYGPGGIILGEVIDSASLAPIDSASVSVSGGCRVWTPADGAFEISGVDAGDSIGVSGYKNGYHGRRAQVTSRVGDTTFVSLQLPRVAPCDPALHPELPRVETVDSAVVLRLPLALATALEHAAPGFEPFRLDWFPAWITGQYDLDCFQAPSAVTGDLNGDGVMDLFARGLSQDTALSIVLVSSPDGYEVLSREQIATAHDVYLLRAEPGRHGSFMADRPLVLTSHGVHEIIEEKASSILYVRDGRLLRYITGD